MLLHTDVSVVVVGSGIAGLTSAIKASELGADVSLISPTYSEASQSVMAMGGINAAMNTKGENDSPDNHYLDTINAGCGINDSKSVLRLTHDAPQIIRWLESIGVSFTRDDNGNVDLRYFGGQKHARTAYAGARTGKQIVTALTALCRRKEAEGSVKRYVGWRFLSLILENNQCFGVICINEDTQEIKAFEGSVILASGGFNGLFGKTSGSVLNDGYVTAKSFMQGVRLANLEMIQYHPTTVQTPSKRMLITEAARGEGGNLYVIENGEKFYFMKEWYPEMAELMPRDVVSQSIYKASDGGRNQVYLDISHLSEDTVKDKLDEVYRICTLYLNIDPTREPVPVYPGVHYFMGGIKTDDNHRTNIEGLFAAGECSCQYHGANRLGGNSLLGAIHGGFIASQNAVLNEFSSTEVVRDSLSSQIDLFNSWKESSSEVLPAGVEDKLSIIMNDSMGIYRNEKDLRNSLSELDNLKCDTSTSSSYYDYVKIRPLVTLAKATLLSAINRKESRGAHQREDYPEAKDEFKKITCIDFDGEIKVSFEGFDE